MKTLKESEMADEFDRAVEQIDKAFDVMHRLMTSGVNDKGKAYLLDLSQAAQRVSFDIEKKQPINEENLRQLEVLLSRSDVESMVPAKRDWLTLRMAAQVAAVVICSGFCMGGLSFMAKSPGDVTLLGAMLVSGAGIIAYLSLKGLIQNMGLSQWKNNKTSQ